MNDEFINTKINKGGDLPIRLPCPKRRSGCLTKIVIGLKEGFGERVVKKSPWKTTTERTKRKKKKVEIKKGRMEFMKNFVTSEVFRLQGRS